MWKLVVEDACIAAAELVLCNDLSASEIEADGGGSKTMFTGGREPASSEMLVEQVGDQCPGLIGQFVGSQAGPRRPPILELEE